MCECGELGPGGEWHVDGAVVGAGSAGSSVQFGGLERIKIKDKG